MTLVIKDRHRARADSRDRAANLDEPPRTGQNSGVSAAAMTRDAHERAAAAGGSRQPSGLPRDLATSVNAATLPPVGPGQGHAGGTGAREGTPANQRGPGKDGQGR